MGSSNDVLSLAGQLGKFDDSPGQLPPVSDWNPKLSGSMDMLIKKDGGWWHEGELIKRDKLARLFSSILKKENENYFLVTPVEKWQITVEDFPFIVSLAEVEVVQGKQKIKLMTNMGDSVELNAKNMIKLDETGLPLVEIRSGLNARFHRNVYYQLAELSNENELGEFMIESGGEAHKLG